MFVLLYVHCQPSAFYFIPLVASCSVAQFKPIVDGELAAKAYGAASSTHHTFTSTEAPSSSGTDTSSGALSPPHSDVVFLLSRVPPPSTASTPPHTLTLVPGVTRLLHNSSRVTLQCRSVVRNERVKPTPPAPNSTVHVTGHLTLLSPEEWAYLFALYPEIPAQLSVGGDTLFTQSVLILQPAAESNSAAFTIPKASIWSPHLRSELLGEANEDCTDSLTPLDAALPHLSERQMLAMFGRPFDALEARMRIGGGVKPASLTRRTPTLSFSGLRTVSEADGSYACHVSAAQSHSSRSWAGAVQLAGWWVPQEANPALPVGTSLASRTPGKRAVLSPASKLRVERVALVPAAKLTCVKGLWLEIHSLMVDKLRQAEEGEKPVSVVDWETLTVVGDVSGVALAQMPSSTTPMTVGVSTVTCNPVHTLPEMGAQRSKPTSSAQLK